MIGLTFNVNGVQGMITEEDLRSEFFMTRHENEDEGCIEDYPTRGWCENWSIKQEECAKILNNNSRALNPKLVYKYNLNGTGKFVSNVVQGILFPTTSQATELSAIQMFAILALLNDTKVNYPHIILEHIFYHKNKVPQYGMILSHLLVNVKNVPVLECRKREVNKGSIVGKASIAKFEVYLWERALRSKWEIYEQFEEVRHEVWNFNGCRAPKAAPIGWVPSTGGVGEEIYPFPQIEASTSQQPRGPDVETTKFLVDTLKKLLEENISLKNEVNSMKSL
ncbi:hypothetical protein LIER_11166 [Lithospermum erythrorhizon]|uniref:Uncharacterized protein n=1 Tax=Lithospermum erythrorhizon TaxID=34254 RepID=A0AAV3PMB9_LITER